MMRLIDCRKKPDWIEVLRCLDANKEAFQCV